MIRLIPWREMEDRQVGVVVGAAVGFEGCWVQVSKSEIGKFLEFHFPCILLKSFSKSYL